MCEAWEMKRTGRSAVGEEGVVLRPSVQAGDGIFSLWKNSMQNGKVEYRKRGLSEH